MKGSHILILILFGSAIAAVITGSLIGGPGRSGESWSEAIFIGLFALFVLIGAAIDRIARKREK